jgi:hypothetical protein
MTLKFLSVFFVLGLVGIRPHRSQTFSVQINSRNLIYMGEMKAKYEVRLQILSASSTNLSALNALADRGHGQSFPYNRSVCNGA